jgi:hypothetical protein
MLPDTPSQKRKEEKEEPLNSEETIKMVKDMEEKLYV